MNIITLTYYMYLDTYCKRNGEFQAAKVKYIVIYIIGYCYSNLAGIITSLMNLLFYVYSNRKSH